MNRHPRSDRAARFAAPTRVAALRLGAASLAACALLSAIPAGAQEAEEEDARTASHPLSGRHALLLFVSYRGNLDVPIHPTVLRRTSGERLANAFAAEEGSFVTYPAVEPLMRKWRVRSERDLALPFLRELADSFDVAHVTVLRLVTYDDRVLLLGRSLSPRTGRLEWADVAEAIHGGDLWKDQAGAFARLDALVDAGARALLQAPAPALPDASPTLLALPLLPIGLGRGESDLAWQCLLHSLLRTGEWTLPDPSLVVNEMQHGGFDPRFLDPRGRDHLVNAFSASRLLVPRLTAFPRPGDTTNPAALVYEDMPVSAELQRRVPVLFTVSLVDGSSGAVVAGGARYLTSENATGLFGRTHQQQIIRRYQGGADQLVRTLLPPEGTS
ncbi:hypothetical protein K8I85_03345 [bacterium]|nr:hypothetical protein [bacterium]